MNTQEENEYQIGKTPLYRLLDGPRLKKMWAAAEEEQAKHIEETKRKYFKDKIMPKDLIDTMSRLPDLISIAINPYRSEQTAKKTMKTVVDRMKKEKKARPWSIELYQNVDCSILGLIDAPYFIFLGIAAENGYDTFKILTDGLRSDCPHAADWEIWSQNQGNNWRSDRCAKLLERWVFLDDDVIQTFNIR